jgi:hypothetical protein
MGWMGGRRLARWLRLSSGGSGALYSSRIKEVSVGRKKGKAGGSVQGQQGRRGECHV